MRWNAINVSRSLLAIFVLACYCLLYVDTVKRRVDVRINAEEDNADENVGDLSKSTISLDIFQNISVSNISLTPDIASFQKIFQVNRSIFGEQALYDDDPEIGGHFFPMPEFDPAFIPPREVAPEWKINQALPGVALFQDSFILGETPLVFTQGRLIDLLPHGLQRSGSGGTKFADPQRWNIKANKVQHCRNRCRRTDRTVLGRSVLPRNDRRDLPRLAYVSNLLADPLINATVLAFPGALTSAGRVEKFWNPFIIGGTPIWLSYEPRNTIYFARHLLVPTGSYCGNSQPSVPSQFSSMPVKASRTWIFSLLA